MFSGDALSRAIHFPKFLNKGVFDEESLLKFDQIDGTPNYAMSVASSFLCRSEEGIHRYGIQAAEKKNERFLKVKGYSPAPLSEEVHYLGYYKFTYGCAVGVEMDHYRVHCDWAPEDGQDEHFQVEFRPNGFAGNKGELRRDRRSAIGILFTLLAGPKRHIAPKDEQFRHDLELIELPTCGE